MKTTEPTIKNGGKNTYHRDGTVSHWDVYNQQWKRLPAEQISDSVLASMNDNERQRIARNAE